MSRQQRIALAMHRRRVVPARCRFVPIADARRSGVFTQMPPMDNSPPVMIDEEGTRWFYMDTATVVENMRRVYKL